MRLGSPARPAAASPPATRSRASCPLTPSPQARAMPLLRPPREPSHRPGSQHRHVSSHGPADLAGTYLPRRTPPMRPAGAALREHQLPRPGHGSSPDTETGSRRGPAVGRQGAARSLGQRDGEDRAPDGIRETKRGPGPDLKRAGRWPAGAAPVGDSGTVRAGPLPGPGRQSAGRGPMGPLDERRQGERDPATPRPLSRPISLLSLTPASRTRPRKTAQPDQRLPQHTPPTRPDTVEHGRARPRQSA
ncbi:hypothetical protein QFZ67_007858 [Streptomyces sp. V1I1]|nr:hypothetical protein [Streptomyces sp. V1I1]